MKYLTKLTIEDPNHTESPVIHLTDEFVWMLRDYYERESLVPAVKLLRSLWGSEILTLKQARAVVKNVSAMRYIASYDNFLIFSLETDL